MIENPEKDEQKELTGCDANVHDSYRTSNVQPLIHNKSYPPV